MGQDIYLNYLTSIKILKTSINKRLAELYTALIISSLQKMVMDNTLPSVISYADVISGISVFKI